MSTLGGFIWSIADQPRGPCRPNQYGNVILPFTILQCLDCSLEPDRATVRALAAKYENPNRLRIAVNQATGRPFYNTSKYGFANLLQDADGLEDNLVALVRRWRGPRPCPYGVIGPTYRVHGMSESSNLMKNGPRAPQTRR